MCLKTIDREVESRTKIFADGVLLEFCHSVRLESRLRWWWLKLVVVGLVRHVSNEFRMSPKELSYLVATHVAS